MTKDEFLSVASPKPTAVFVPEWDKTLYVRVMNGPERFKWRCDVDANEDNGEKNQASLLVKCICDEQGNRLFGDEDQEVVASKDGRVLERLMVEAWSVNKMDKDSTEQLKKN